MNVDVRGYREGDERLPLSDQEKLKKLLRDHQAAVDEAARLRGKQKAKGRGRATKRSRAAISKQDSAVHKLWEQICAIREGRGGAAPQETADPPANALEHQAAENAGKHAPNLTVLARGGECPGHHALAGASPAG